MWNKYKHNTNNNNRNNLSHKHTQQHTTINTFFNNVDNEANGTQSHTTQTMQYIYIIIISMIYTIKQSPSTFQLTYMQHTHQSNTNKIRNTIYIYIYKTQYKTTQTQNT